MEVTWPHHPDYIAGLSASDYNTQLKTHTDYTEITQTVYEHLRQNRVKEAFDYIAIQTVDTHFKDRLYRWALNKVREYPHLVVLYKRDVQK